jgi:hypothetical protein
VDTERVVARQQQMNAGTWKQLTDRGVSQDQELRLDFFYAAPSEDAAAQLTERLVSTGCEASASSSKKGLLGKRTWGVAGQTAPMAVSLPALDAWVRTMVEVGASCGGCEFDGWGTAL